jgi:hypothetical protein
LSASAEWDELPAAVREAVEQHTGPVAGTSPGGEGMSTSLRLILHTARGDVFAKGTGPDSTTHQERRLALGAAMAPHVTTIAPPLLWQARAGGWNITGWPALPGRPWADHKPGTPDMPKMTRLLRELSTIPAPPELTRTAREDWGRYTDNPDLLDGDMIVHRDPNPTNFVINGDRAWMVDWGWAVRGPAWLTPALLVLSMMEAGWKPADAEPALAAVPAWNNAPPRAVTAFADAEARSWDAAVERAPTKVRKFRAAIARAWADHRAEPAGARHLGRQAPHKPRTHPGQPHARPYGHCHPHPSPQTPRPAGAAAPLRLRKKFLTSPPQRARGGEVRNHYSKAPPQKQKNKKQEQRKQRQSQSQDQGQNRKGTRNPPPPEKHGPVPGSPCTPSCLPKRSKSKTRQHRPATATGETARQTHAALTHGTTSKAHHPSAERRQPRPRTPSRAQPARPCATARPGERNEESASEQNPPEPGFPARAAGLRTRGHCSRTAATPPAERREFRPRGWWCHAPGPRGPRSRLPRTMPHRYPNS